MSIMAATLIGALAILVGPLLGALTTGWVQHRFWKRPRADLADAVRDAG